MPPEGRGEEEQGVQARAPTAMTFTDGRKERPARPPPTAARRLAGLATMPRGVSEDRLRRNPHPLVPERASGEAPGSVPAKSEVGSPRHRRSDGLIRHAGQGADCGPRLLR
jgi:hypothetical protein